MTEANNTFGNEQSLPVFQRLNVETVESFVICEVKGDQTGDASINQAITIGLFIDLLDEQRVPVKLIGQ